ncbi:hypothetical protein FSP39_013557 [Pinctada imbricata]|uniref:Sorting nexin 13 n=1 Tax=Pinctada imbricata TaxID=66713 RepID=A0AA89BKN3_PINIB|nr:hypothetical protein FSP39_013557 [Pinctada imbricata]
MDWLEGGWRWPVLGLVLFFLSFGTVGLYGLFYAFCILCGGMMIALYHGRALSTASYKGIPVLPKSKPGVNKVTGKMENLVKARNFDKRMTGAMVIDEVLQEVLKYTIRDYMKSWYRQLSDHDGFLLDIRQTAQRIAITFAIRSKDVDWMPYFTQRLVDDFASHIRLYRRARDNVKVPPTDESFEEQVQTAFFDAEVNMEKDKCRDMVSLDPEAERQYLQDLSEVLLFLLLPPEDFQNKSFRYILREVIVNGIFLPTINLISDPDYLNQYMAWMCKETSFTNETFLQVVKSTNCLEELEAVKGITEQDIAKWRSQDSGGEDDAMIKKNLNSLLFVKNVCEGRIKRIQDGTDLLEEAPDFCRAKNIFVLSLDEIIENNIALQKFIEFMSGIGGQQYLFFYLNVEGFRAAAGQQISEAHQRALDGIGQEADLESLRRAAMIIHDQYLSDKASSRIRIESDIVKRTLLKIKSKYISEDLFDEVQSRVYHILLGENYYEAFLQSSVYAKMLEDIGLAKPPRSEDGDSLSLDDGMYNIMIPGLIMSLMEDGQNSSEESSLPRSRSDSPVVEPTITAYISQTGIVKESEKNSSNKSYAVFAIRATKRYGEEEEISETYRRYSDFHDLNMLIQEKFPEYQGPVLPSKTVLKNMNKEFLEKRRKALDQYLQVLMKPDLWLQYSGMKELVLKFVAPGLWEKHKSELARKMDTVVNPLRSSIKHVGRAVTTDSLVDGIGKVFRGVRNIDISDSENIPLRIMLLLMDEVFDLREKNAWMRRRIMGILRQLIKVTFGDSINRKIVDQVDYMTSAEQMAEYIKKFRDSFWPNGVLAEPRPERDLHTKMRTRVFCKAKMLGSVSDDFRHLMGTETIKLGVFRIFDMFQHKCLNKRFVYVFLEGVITTLMPQNKFDELFCKLHSRSERVARALKARASKSSDSNTDSILRKRRR